MCFNSYHKAIAGMVKMWVVLLFLSLLATDGLAFIQIHGNVSGEEEREYKILVGNTETNNIVAYDLKSGTFLGEFIAAGTGGLMSPDGLVMGPDSMLYISSGLNEAHDGQGILKFHPKTGKFLGRFTHFENDEISILRPYGLAFGPDGHLYVASFRSDEILRFDGKTGGFMDFFAKGAGKENGLNGPNGLFFTPEGKLLVSTQGSVALHEGNGEIDFRFDSQILSYDLATKESSVWASPGNLDQNDAGFSSLLGFSITPDGKGVFISDFGGGILEYSLEGELLNVYKSKGFQGYLAVFNDRILIPSFDPETLDGHIKCIDLINRNESHKVKVLVTDKMHLRRPVGILIVPQ